MNTTAPETPQSRWRVLITPWKWSRWTLAMLAPLLLATYFLSAVPVTRLVRQKLRSSAGGLVSLVYRPLFFLNEHSVAVNRIVLWEEHAMDGILGLEYLPPACILQRVDIPPEPAPTTQADPSL